MPEVIRETSLQPATPFSFRIIGHFWFLILLTYSIVYVAERFTYVDSAWQFFQRINGNGFIFPSGRYGVFFSQIPVFIALKCNASFGILAYTFSMSYILLYYFLWYLCTSILKNPTAGIAILFCTFMGVREGFLHPVTETQQCLMFSVLLYAQLRHLSSKSIIGTGLIVFTTLLILFTHPVGVFTAGFATILFMVESKDFRSRTSWLVLIILGGVTLWRFFFPVDNYDAAFYDQLKGNGIAEQTAGNGALNFLFVHFVNFYWVPAFAGLVAVVWLALKKDWMRLGLTLTGVGVYILIAATTYSNGDSSILMERAFLPACFMISLVLAGLLAQTNFSRKWIPAVIILFFMVNGMRYINNGCLMFQKRTAFLDELIVRANQTDHDKFFIVPTNEDMEKIAIPWGLGTETLMYSTFRYDRPITITYQNETCDSLRIRITSFYCLPADSLNRRYFPVSNKPYIALP